MTIMVMGISFTVIWLGTIFYFVRYIKKIKDELSGGFSDKQKPFEKKNEKKIRIALDKDCPPLTLEDVGQLVYNAFDKVKRADPENLSNLIKQEHPQIIALVLAHLEPDKASAILQKFPTDLQSDVSLRIANLNPVSSEVTREIERVLEKKLGALSTENYTRAGGVESIVKILNHADSDSKKQIIKMLEDKDPEISYEILKNFPSLLKNWHPDFTSLQETARR